MIKWPPIQANRYALLADTFEEASCAHVSDITRILIIVLFRLDLVKHDTAAKYAIRTRPLQDFGKRWWARMRYEALMKPL